MTDQSYYEQYLIVCNDLDKNIRKTIYKTSKFDKIVKK